MKIRQGFVSNSSSSSFVIAYKPGAKCKTCGHTDDSMTLIEKASENGYSDTSVDAEGFDDVIEYLKECEGYDDDEFKGDEDIQEIVSRMKKFQKKNYEFAAVSISYNDDFIRSSLQQSKNVEILKGDDE